MEPGMLRTGLELFMAAFWTIWAIVAMKIVSKHIEDTMLEWLITPLNILFGSMVAISALLIPFAMYEIWKKKKTKN